MQGQTSIHVDAPPGRLYDLITDVRRMGEWSPETYRAEWVGGATGPAVGAKFKGWNKRGFLRWSTTPEVLAATPGEEFAFKAGHTTWTYRFSPAATGAGGTDVTESFSLQPNLLDKVLDRIVAPRGNREQQLVEGMRRTLERLKAAAERPA